MMRLSCVTDAVEEGGLWFNKPKSIYTQEDIEILSNPLWRDDNTQVALARSRQKDDLGAGLNRPLLEAVIPLPIKSREKHSFIGRTRDKPLSLGFKGSWEATNNKEK